MSHQDFVRRFEEYLGAVYHPSGGNRRDTGRRKLAAAITAQLRLQGASRILDCAAGTGCASLDVHLEAPNEFTIHCCDGDPAMVAILVEQALERDLDLASMAPRPPPPGDPENLAAAMVVDWSDLDRLADDYDYVLCRGNALIYADTWTGDDQVASADTIHDYLERMADRVRPGGHLHVDAPRTIELKPTIRRVLGDETTARSIEEQVSIEDGVRRRWELSFRDGAAEPVTFTRYSSLLTIYDIQEILKDLELVDTEVCTLTDERPNFGVIIARKPG